MTESTEILVQLMNEGVVVWRPVEAKLIRDGVYQIVDQPYDRDTERWQFEPGDCVGCELVDAYEGRILAAIRRI